MSRRAQAILYGTLWCYLCWGCIIAIAWLNAAPLTRGEAAAFVLLGLAVPPLMTVLTMLAVWR